MSFQDDLLRNMRTKDEAEAAHNEEMMQIAAQHAQYSISNIKNALLTASNNGKYELIDGKKTAVCYISFPEHCQNYLTLKEESEYIPATPSNFELHLKELTQAAPNQRKAILEKYKGVNLSAGGSPAHYRKSVCFKIDTALNQECGCFIHMLSQYCNDENITLDIVVYDTYTGNYHPLHTPIYNSSTYVFDYRLYAKCSCLIPDKYSSDIPFIEIEESPNPQPTGISIDYMDGHQFEKFCGELLRKNGYYDVDVTRGSGDQGIDIIAFKDGIKFGIQCKCYASDIGNKAVQEAFSGKTYYNCHVGAVLTNRYFTRSAIDLAKKNGVLLWDRGHLLDMVKKAGVMVDEE